MPRLRGQTFDEYPHRDFSRDGIIHKESNRFRAERKRAAYTKDKTALNVILSNCTRPRTGQPVCVWGKYLFRMVKMLRF